MKVYKFGGASVKDADGVKNLLSVLTKTGIKNTLIVVSAMGKTTNALEKVIESYFADKTKTPPELLEIKAYHLDIIEGLFYSKKQRSN